MPLSVTKIRQSQELIVEVFRQFRTELMESYGEIEHISKVDGSPVTELDIKLEVALKQRLHDRFPEIGFQGEETEATPSSVGAVWYVDPIDGTSSFIHGLPYCTNMAGLVVDGKTVASVIYQFPTNDLYTAIIGEGAYKNGKRIFVKNVDLDKSIMFVGPFVYINTHDIFAPYGINTYAPIGASGYEFTRLAGGNIQGVTKLHCKSKIHDDIPGVLLVTEAGGEIISFEGSEYVYDNLSFVAATPKLADMIRKNYQNIKDIIES